MQTFVIVRPPPSSTKRTLNLQIQLVANVKQKKASDGRQSRSASGSSLASSAGPTTATFRSLNIPEAIPGSAATTNATGTPREVDFRTSTIRNAAQSRDASPTRKLSIPIEDGPGRLRSRKPVHKRTSSMSLDGGIREKKQDILDNVRTDRPLSLSMVMPPRPSDNAAELPRGDGLESDMSFVEGGNERSFENAEDTPKDRTVSRCSSIRSIRSNNSYASTSASGASGISLSGLSVSSSTSRTRSGKGKIVPLYNLAVSERGIFPRGDGSA